MFLFLIFDETDKISLIDYNLSEMFKEKLQNEFLIFWQFSKKILTKTENDFRLISNFVLKTFFTDPS